MRYVGYLSLIPLLLSSLLSLPYASAQQGVFDEMYDDFDKDEDEEDEWGAQSARGPSAVSALPCTPRDDRIAELEGLVTLYFQDAQTGAPISRATVSLGQSSGETTPQGCVRLKKPTGSDLMDDKVIARFRSPDYVNLDAQLHFMAGELFFNRYSVSKRLKPGKLRVVLDWDAKPTDLDAHLVREGMYHISFRDMRSYQDRAALDRDDRDGHGPETVTVERLDPSANYSYFVYDYTRSGSMGDQSRARVHVYSERGLLRTFIIPKQLGGDRWEVFRIVEGEIKLP